MLTSRRQFLAMPIAAAELRASTQMFLAGIVPAGRTPPDGQVKAYWSHCDEVAKLRFHRIEINNTRARIAEYYSKRIPEFKDGMAARTLDIAGLALFSRAAESSDLQGLIDGHMLLGRFLAETGGKYIAHMIAPGTVLNESGDEAVYRAIDLKVWARNANEIGRRLFHECGVKLAYHPEQAEVRTGLYKRFLDATDERSVYFLPDTGHIVSGGADVVKICQEYRSRLVCVHLKDFAPVRTMDRGMTAGNVPLGEGVVNIAGVIAELRNTNFTGYVMSESRGTNQTTHDYMIETLGIDI